MATKPPPPSTKLDWLRVGLSLLAREGDGGLTIEALCALMDRTKGSFYHHFAGRDGFVTALLDHWETAFTGRFIEELEELDDPRARLRALGRRTADEVDLELERAIRMWSERELRARLVVERVDRAREEYMWQQFAVVLGDPHRARLAARAHLALLVGTEILYHDLSRAELHELADFTGRLGYPARGGPTDPRTPEEEP